MDECFSFASSSIASLMLLLRHGYSSVHVENSAPTDAPGYQTVVFAEVIDFSRDQVSRGGFVHCATITFRRLMLQTTT